MAGKRIRDLVVRIRANTAELTTAMGRAAQLTESVGRRMEDVGSTLSTRLSLPLLAVGGASLKMAADAKESENLFSVSMGRMEGAGRDFSVRLRRELGLNEYAVRRNVGTLQAMTESMGLSTDVAYQLSTGLAQLSADMESFYNLRDGEGFQKLQSGLSGEAEPLKRLGILVTENVVQQTLLRRGLIESGQALTEQQKVLGRYIAIVEQTSKAQGDLARTQDSELNMTRRLRAEVAQMAVRIGEGLLPAYNAALKVGLRMVAWVAQAVEKFNAMAPSVRNATLATAGFVAVLGPMLVGMGSLLRIVGGLRGAFLLLTNPVGITVAAVGTLAFAAVTLVRNWDVASLRLTLAWTAIKDAVYTAVDAVLAGIERLTSRVPFLGDKVRELRESFSHLADDSLARSNDRILELEGRIAANFTPAVTGAATSADDFKLSLEGLDAAFRALGGTGEGTGSVVQAAGALAQFQEGLFNQQFQDRVQATYGALAVGVQRTAQEYASAADRVTSANQEIASGIASAFNTSRASFREFAADFLRRIRDIIARMLVFRALASIFAPYSGQTGLLGSLFTEFNRFGGARAAGGPIRPGRTYLVGERGPELIDSRASGTVIPMSRAQPAASPSVTFSFDASRIPAPSNPLAAARDSDWLRFIGETLRSWEDNGGRFRYAGG